MIKENDTIKMSYVLVRSVILPWFALLDAIAMESQTIG